MLEIKNLSISFKKQDVLKNVNIKIKQGEKVAIIGDSGSGKSTLFNCILNNLKPTKGNIFYLEKNIFNYSSKEKVNYKRYEICHVSQSLDLFEELTIYENLDLFYKQNKIIEILKQTNFYEMKDKKVKYLSGGQRQKVAIIKAYLSNANLYLFDEITSALDLNTARDVLDFLFTNLANKTILFITHQKELMLPYATTVYQIENKHISLTKQEKIEAKKEIKNVRKEKTYHIYNKELKSFIKHPISLIVLIMTTILTCLSLYFRLTFNNNYLNQIQTVLNQYYDQNVLTIKNYKEDKISNLKLDVSLDLFFKDISLYNDKSLLTSYSFKPMKDMDAIFAINQDFIFSNSIKSDKLIIKYKQWIKDKYYSFEYEYNDVKKIKEAGMFNKPYIYYNYDYFKNLLMDIKLDNESFYDYLLNNQNNDYLYFINDSLYQFYSNNKNHELFNNNPLAMKFNANDSYFYSDALLDLYANLLLFDSSKGLVDFFLMFCVIGSLLITFLFFTSLLYKNFKKIALYLDNGASYLECYFIYYLEIFIAILFSFICFIIFKFIDRFMLFCLLILLLEYLFILYFVIFYFEKKQLITFLKEDEAC